MTLSPCIVCGTPADGTRCPDHTNPYSPKAPTTARGYDWAWQQLSRRARRMQPFCEDCSTTDDLTTDHTPEAWKRKAAGKAVRLQDVAVTCRGCNARRGQARPTDRNLAPTRGYRATDPLPDPLAKAKFELHTDGVSL